MSDDAPPQKFTEADAKDLEKFREEFEKHKDDLAAGPVKNRSTTDIFCCMLFIIFLGGMGCVFGYGVYYGKPSQITIGWDGDKLGCGYSEEVKDFPYLYFAKPPTPDQLKVLTAAEPNLVKIRETALDLMRIGVCVKECPKVEGPVSCKPTKQMLEDCSGQGGCVCGMIEESDEVIDFRYDTIQTPWENGFCVPTASGKDEKIKAVTEALLNTWKKSSSGSKVEGYLKDIVDSWAVLLISSVTALIFGYLYLWIIRLIGGSIIWLSIVVIQLALVFAGAYTWYYRGRKYSVEDDMFKYLTYAAYVIWALAGVVFILVCCFWHAIKIGIAVFKTTSQYVQANLKIFALPLISYLVIGLWSLFWIFGAIHVFSIGTPVSRDDGYPFLTEVKWTKMTRIAFFYDVFGLFWINAFIIGVCQFIIGCSACLWYFECMTDTKGSGTVGRAFYWSYRYHLGSVAFGSFIIAVCQMLRFLFEYYRKKIGVAEKTKLVKALLCLTSYLLYLMDKCVKYISKNAYIQVALTNNHFFKSAWNGFALIIKNAHRFGAANSIGSIYMVFGAICIMAANGLVGYLFLTNFPSVVEVGSPIPPVVAICVISGTIAYTFLSIFSFSSDAILQSFLLDEELRFSGQNRPEYMQEFAAELKKRGKGCCS